MFTFQLSLRIEVADKAAAIDLTNAIKMLSESYGTGHLDSSYIEPTITDKPTLQIKKREPK